MAYLAHEHVLLPRRAPLFVASLSASLEVVDTRIDSQFPADTNGLTRACLLAQAVGGVLDVEDGSFAFGPYAVVLDHSGPG